MIKAIIFDFFGVLSTEGFRVFRNKYFEDSPKRALSQRLMDQHTLGNLSYEVFVEKLSKLAGVTTEVADDYLGKNKPNEPLIDFIRERLKPHYKIGVLSNAGADWMHESFAKEDIELFDDIVVSYHFGLNKPNEEIYELTARRLKVEPSECVFVDDIGRYCGAARAVGMETILYEDFPQMKNDLEKLLG